MDIQIQSAAMPTDLLPTGNRKPVPWGAISISLIVIAYGILLFARFAPAISEPDANGYWAQGSLLMTTGKTWFTPESDAQYIGMHWLLTPEGTYVSRYPPGLAVAIGAIYSTLGHRAGVFINPLMAVLSLLGMYKLCRRMMPAGWSITAAVLLAINPSFFQHAIENFAHMAVACVVVWGLYFLVCWSQDGRVWQVFCAGVLLGCIPTIRYPDAIMGVSVAVFLLMNVRKFRHIWLHYFCALLGAAIPVVPLLLRNQRVLGSPWRTGYALTNEQTGFGWNYFKQHALNYVQQMNSDGLGMMFALGVVAITWMVCSRRNRALGAMLALMTVPMVLLYMAYYWAPQMNAGATMRFLVPIFPCFIFAGVWLLNEATLGATTAARVAIPIVLVGLQMLIGTPEALQRTGQLKYQRSVLSAVTGGVEDVIPAGSVIVASNGVQQQLDYVRKWKLADESVARGTGPGMRGGGMFGRGDDEPSPMQAEKREAQRAKYSGTSEQREDQFVEDIRAWAGGSKIYLVGAEREIRNSIASAIDPDSVKIVRRIALPKQPDMTVGVENRRGRVGMMGGGGGPGGMMGGGGMGSRPGGGGGGGPMGLGALNGETECVIAEWTLPAPVR